MTEAAHNSTASPQSASAEVVAVCISSGGVPKHPVASAEATIDGLDGDAHDHDKHCRPDRAVSIQDLELLEELETEGYAVGPGVIGENLTVRGLNVQQLSPGDRLVIEDGPVLELVAPRKPCFVLDAIHPQLQYAVVGRCGFMARVQRTGRLYPGQRIAVQTRSDARSSQD
jgi:MOSC domain-containing protein YiiM